MLKENINIDDSYTDRVVRQLVDETEIDFKNNRVNLPSANFSFPFYSFGSRRAYPENLISEPKSNFGKYVISNYGVDETEYKEIYAMYMGIIASRLQDHDENVNHLYLHEHTEFDEKEYHYATQVLDRMVRESKIDNSHEDPSQWNIHAPHMGRWISPMGFISPNTRHWNAFEDYVMDIYGLDWELVGWTWNNYRKEVNKNFRLLARKAMGDDSPQYDYLAESIEDNFLDKIVNQLVDETHVFNDRGQLRANPPFFQSEWEDVEVEGRATGVVGGIRLAELIASVESKEFDYSLAFMDFKYYCKQIYGLSWEECHEVWDKYREALYNTDFSHLYTPNINLDESSLNPSYRESEAVPKPLDRIVYQLVNETIIEDDEYGIPVAYPSWITDEGFGGEGVALDILLDSDKMSVNFTEFSLYVEEMYGLNEAEVDEVWSSYKGWLWEKEQQNVYTYQKSLEDDELNESLNSRVKKEVEDLFDKDKKLKGEHKIKKYFEDKGLNKQDADEAMVQYLSKQQSLNESPDDLNSYIQKGVDKMVGNTPYIHKVVNTMVDNTHLSGEKTTNSIRVKLPFSIEDNIQRQFDEIGQYYITSPTARVVAEIRKHLILIYAMDKWETDQATLMYLSKMTEKINDYKGEGLNESIETKEENHLDKVVDQIVSETMVNYRRGEIQFPFVQHQTSSPAYPIFGLRHSFPPSSTFITSFYKYCRDVYGLTEDEMEYIWEKYQINLKEILNKTLNESVDLSYSDDKDFPFLNKLANHTMSVTEIGRNAVMFPFIDGYISDGNFHKYFHGTPYDQLPFEATLKLDEYLRDFGLTENEKEIWWDIYVIKVIDAINERDSRIIDSHGELYESTGDIYEKIANSVVRESDIVEQEGKLFLRSPAFDGGVNVEIVLEIMSGMTKSGIPNSFVRHMKEVYNIEKKGYNTELQTIWRLYRDKMIERIKIKQAILRQIPPKQQKFFDHILKTLVDGTEVQTMKDWIPDDETYEQKVWVTPPFINHAHDLGVDPHREESVEWNEFSYFGYGYPRYMKDIYGLTDKEGLKLWAIYYKAVQKKVDELIERDRIIYGDD